MHINNQIIHFNNFCYFFYFCQNVNTIYFKALYSLYLLTLLTWMCYFFELTLFIHDVGFPWFLLVFFFFLYPFFQSWSVFQGSISMVHLEMVHIMPFAFVCFSESSSGACPPTVISLVACFCPSLLTSICYLPEPVFIL